MKNKILILLPVVVVLYLSLPYLHDEPATPKTIHKIQPTSFSKYSKKSSSNSQSIAPTISPENEKNDLSTLSSEIKKEALSMDAIDANPTQTQSRLEMLARSLSISEQKYILSQVTNAKVSKNERFLGLYLLSLNSETPHEIFSTIAVLDHQVLHRSHAPHSADEAEALFLTSLSLKALDSLQIKVLEGSTSDEELIKVSKLSKNPVVKKMAMAAWQSVKKGTRLAMEVQ